MGRKCPTTSTGAVAWLDDENTHELKVGEISIHFKRVHETVQATRNVRKRDKRIAKVQDSSEENNNAR